MTHPGRMEANPRARIGLVAALATSIWSSGCFAPNQFDDIESTSSTTSDTDSIDETSTGGTSSGRATTTPPAGSTSTEGTTSASDSTAGEETTDDDSGETGEVQVCESTSPYDGPGDCDPYAQDCPAGSKCAPYGDGSAWESTRCVPLDAAPVDVGSPCVVQGAGTSGQDNCVEGAMCFHLDPQTQEGVCVALCGCGPDQGVCEDPATCVIANGGALPLCMVACDPLVQNCPAGQLCGPTNDGFACAPDVSGSEGSQGDSCDTTNGCDPGFTCVVGEVVPDCDSNGCCSSFCDLENPAGACVAGQTCQPWFDEPPPEFANVGVCAGPV